jgi:surface polysaccharide O-acyltransferase-like enzyme
MGLAGVEMRYPVALLGFVVDCAFALACVSGCLFVLAAALRFGTMRSSVLEGLANSAFGIYLLHYVFVVWLQYALLHAGLFAIVKGTIVFAGSLGLAWAATAAMRLVPIGSALIGEAHQRGKAAPKFPAPTLARQ